MANKVLGYRRQGTPQPEPRRWASSHMTHKINLDDLTRNSFLLRHLAYGNRQVCQELKFTRASDSEMSNGWGHYGLLLQMLVSELFIETAIKLRIILDALREQETKQSLDTTFESIFTGDDNVGQYIPSMKDLRIREACNKIIHANKVILEWENADRNEHEYWKWTIILVGNK